MSEEKDIQLVARICQKTIKGQIRWEKTSDVGVYQTTLSAYLVTFEQRANDEKPRLCLYDTEGMLMESYTADAMADPGTQKYFQIRNLMIQAYANARRKAMGVDKAIDDVLSELGE